MDFEDVFERFVGVENVIIANECDAFREGLENLKPLVECLVRRLSTYVGVLTLLLNQISDDAIDEGCVDCLDDKLIDLLTKKLHSDAVH